MPVVKMPEVKMPGVKMPEVKMPEVKMPEEKLPGVKIPEVNEFCHYYPYQPRCTSKNGFAFLDRLLPSAARRLCRGKRGTESGASELL